MHIQSFLSPISYPVSRWIVALLMLSACLMAEAKVYTCNLSKGYFSNGEISKSDNRICKGRFTDDSSVEWEYQRTRTAGNIDQNAVAAYQDGTIIFGDAKGQKAETVVFTTEYFSNVKVSKVEVSCYSSSDAGHSLTVMVNGQAYVSAQSLSSGLDTYSATSSNEQKGTLVVTLQASSSKVSVLHLQSIKVYTEEPIFVHTQGHYSSLVNGQQDVHTETRIIYATADSDIKLRRNYEAFQTYVRWYDYETDSAVADLSYFSPFDQPNSVSQTPDYLYNSCGAISTKKSETLVNGLCAQYHYAGTGVVKIACDQSAYTDYKIETSDNGYTTTITEPTLSQRIIYEIRPASEMTSRMEVCKNSNSWFEEYSMIAPIGNALLLSPQFPMFSPAEQPGYYYGNGVSTLMTGGTWTLITYRYGGYSSTTLDASNTTAGQWFPVDAHWSVGNVEYMLRWKSPSGDEYNIAKWTVSYHNVYGVGPFLMNEPACLVGSTVIAEEHFNSYCAPAATYNRSSAPLPAPRSSYGFYCTPLQHVGVNDGVDCPGLMEYSLVNNGRGFNNSPWWYNDGGEYNVFANHIGNAAATDITAGYALYANAMAKPQLVYSMDIPVSKIPASTIFVSAYVGHVGQTNVTPALDFELVGTDAQGEHLLLTYSTGQLNVNADQSYDCKMGWRRILFPYEFTASPSSYTKLQLRIISKARDNTVRGFFLDDIAVYAQGKGSTFAHFQHQKGRFRNMMENNSIGHYQQQAVHEERRVIYAKKGDVVALSRRSDAFQQYVRWYDYATDQMMNNLQVVNTQTGTNAKLVSGLNFGILNYTASNSVRITNTTATFTYTGGDTVYVGCDQSAYTDFTETTADGLTTFTEPTLSQRIIYEIRPASEMAKAVSACTTKSGKWLEEYTLFAPPEQYILVGPKYAYTNLVGQQYPHYKYTNADAVIPNYYCKQEDKVLALKDGAWTWTENSAEPIRTKDIYNGQFYRYDDKTTGNITFELTCKLNGITYQIARFNVVRDNIQYPTQKRDSACLKNYRMLYCETFNYDSPGRGTHRYSKPLDAMQSELGFFTDNTNHFATNVNNNGQGVTNNQGVCEYALVNDGSWWDNGGALQTNNYDNFANRDGLKTDRYSGVDGSKGYALNFKENSKQIKVYSLDIPNVYSSSDDIFVSAYLGARTENTDPQLDFEIVGVMADESEIPVATYMTGNITDMWGWYRVLFGFKASDQAGIHHYQLRIVYKGISVSPSCIFLDDIAVYVPKNADDPQDDPPTPTQVQFNHKIGMYRSGYEQNKVGHYSQQAVHEDWNVVYAPACTLRLSRNDDAFQQYVRWFNYQTDQEMVGLEARAIQAATGSHYLSGAKAGLINCTASAADRIAGSTPFRAIYPYDGKSIVYIGCDQSAYTDFSLQTTSTPAVFTEPTLSQRIVYEIRPASEMAAKVERYKDFTDVDTAHWMEKYDIQASGWRTIYLGPQYAIKAVSGKFANYYYNSTTPTQMAGGVWKLADWNGTAWVEKITANDMNLIEGQYLAVTDYAGDVERTYGLTCTIGGHTYNVALFRVSYKNDRGQEGVGPSVFYNHGDTARISGATILAEEHFGAANSSLKGVENAHNATPLQAAASSYGFFSHAVNDAVSNHVRVDYKQASAYANNYPGYCEYALVNDGSGWSSSSTGDGFNAAFANHIGNKFQTDADNGYALFVNGGSKPGVVYSMDFHAELCLGAKMYMSAYIGELGGGAMPPVLDFQVLGVDENGQDTLLTTFTTGELLRNNPSYDTRYLWHRILFPFTYSGNVDYDHFNLRIINKSQPNKHNGIFIDDVAVYLCPSPLQILLPSTVAAGENPGDVDICEESSVAPGQNKEETSTEKMVFYMRIDCGQYAEYISGGTTLFYRWTESETQTPVPDASGSVALPQISATHYVPTEYVIESFAKFDALYRNTDTVAFKFIREVDIAPIQVTNTERYILYIACPVSGFQKGKEYTCEISNTGTFSGENTLVCSKNVSVKADKGMQIVSDVDMMEASCTNHSFNLRLIMKYVKLNASGTSSALYSAQYVAHWLYGSEPKPGEETAFMDRYGASYQTIQMAIMHYIADSKNATETPSLTVAEKQLIEALVRKGLLVLGETLNPADPALTVVPQAGSTQLIYTAFPIRPVEAGVPYCSKPQTIVVKLTNDDSAYAVQVVKDYNEPALPDVVAARPRRVRIPHTRPSGSRFNQLDIKLKLSHPKVRYYFRDLTFESSTDPDYRSLSAANPLKCVASASSDNQLSSDAPALSFSGFEPMKEGHSYTFRLRFYLDPEQPVDDDCRDNNGRVPDMESRITFMVVPNMLTFKPAAVDADEWTTLAWNNDAHWVFTSTDSRAEAFAPLASTSVVFRSGDHILKDTISATDLEPGSQDYIAYDIGFEPYTCRRVHVPAHTAIVGQENIRSADAWSFDMPIVGGQWNMTAMPVKGVVTGDIFLPASIVNGDESKTEPFANNAISQQLSQPAEDRLTYPFYNSFFSEKGLVQVEADGSTTAIETSGWSYATNSLTMPLDGKAWTLGLNVGGNYVMRLPKDRPADLAYRYFQYGAWVSMSEPIAMTKDYGRPIYTQSPYESTITNGFDGDYFIFGNPTFAYIDLVKFYAANSESISSTVYLSGIGNTDRYNHLAAQVTESGWESVDLTSTTRYLPPMTAVMLMRKTSNPQQHCLTLTLTEDMLTTHDGRGKQADRMSAPAISLHTDSAKWDSDERALAIMAEANGSRSYALLTESADAHMEAVDGEDATVFMLDANKTPFAVYTAASGKALAINHIPLDTLVSIPLAAYAINDIASINLTFSGNNRYLTGWEFVDRITNRRMVLHDGATAEMQISDNKATRYYLEHVRCMIPQDEWMGVEDESFHTIIQPGSIIVLADEPIEMLRLYDASGKLIAHKHQPSSGISLSVPAGFYTLLVNQKAVKVIVP